MLNNTNYFTAENNLKYCGSTQYKDFFGSLGTGGCEARAMAKLKGEWQDEKTTALLVGSYVDAWFEGTLEDFKQRNPEIFMKNGELKSEYRRAEQIIKVAQEDELFMNFMSGSKQEIFTGEICGVPFKVKLDSYIPGMMIVDLKVIAKIREFKWTKDYGKLNFVDYWGYDIQGAIYREIVKQNIGKELPFYIAALSKEPVTDKEIIWLPPAKLDAALIEIENNMPRLQALKSGDAQPVRCENCDYCTSTRKLTTPINVESLQERI